MFDQVVVKRSANYHCDKISAWGPFETGTTAKQKCPLSLEVLVKRHRLYNQITRHGIVIYAAMTKLKPRYMRDCGIKICEPTTSCITCMHADKTHCIWSWEHYKKITSTTLHHASNTVAICQV